jgi:internalin A
MAKKTKVSMSLEDLKSYLLTKYLEVFDFFTFPCCGLLWDTDLQNYLVINESRTKYFSAQHINSKNPLFNISLNDDDLLDDLTTELYLVDRGLETISSLRGLKSIGDDKHLNLNNNGIEDISPLQNIVMGGLHVDNNILTRFPPNLSTSIKTIAAQFNNISDISNLSSLTNLKYLYLWGNKITDISPLSTLTNLRSLRLRDNDIQDFSPLQYLTNLEALDISLYNRCDISFAKSLVNLKRIVLDGGSKLFAQEIKNLLPEGCVMGHSNAT